MLKKVISGGQDGVDVAGLRAASACGIPTGGFCPKGCRTVRGPDPARMAEYGLIETPTTSYTERTRRNVEAADGTIIFMMDPRSPGTRWTLRCADKMRKPTLTLMATLLDAWVDMVADWIHRYNIETLNVAGSRSSAVEEGVACFLADVFRALQKDSWLT